MPQPRQGNTESEAEAEAEAGTEARGGARAQTEAEAGAAAAAGAAAVAEAVAEAAAAAAAAAVILDVRVPCGLASARAMNLDAFINKWSASENSERANKDLFLSEFCDVLGVPRPDAATGKPEKDLYVFEKTIPVDDQDGKTTQKRADLYKHGCFLLEAKQTAAAGSKAKGKTKRGTQSWDVAMTDAYGQARGYLDVLDAPPPFLIVCDIGFVFELYADFDGSRRWQPFPNAQKKRIYLKDLASHTDTLRSIFTDPLSLDPSRRAEKVTREVAESLAELAKKLEAEKHAPEAVAKFLMRCLFTMFAEDVGLLPKNLLSHAIEEEWLPNPQKFPGGIETLWQAMNEGKHFGFVGKLLRFNGGLFAQPSALKLGRDALGLLLAAAKKDWSSVEPAIFGTLLERALDPKERHKLGAHYTPRAYVERLVRPTIEEPLREEWENVQTAARKLYLDGKEKEARDVVRVFHQKLTMTRVLDPACGSGNFLYVTLDLFKRLESEILALLHDMGERQELLHVEGIRVTPRQFLGIEIKPWAKEITELVLWIGYLQWHYRTNGRLIPPPEPVLGDFKNIECRDAVLAYDREELVRDEKGKPVTRWDGVTMKKHPVTGEDVPDEKAVVPIYRYVNPRKAIWPEAEFVVGNPPFIGNWRMRSELGDGYTETLRRVYSDIPDSVDFVMYWWDRAAELVRTGKIRRAGLITTTSITHTFNRRVIQRHMDATPSISIAFAIGDHPWTTAKYDQTAGGAEVRTAMTVMVADDVIGRRGYVVHEYQADDEVRVELSWKTGHVHSDLTIGANVAAAMPLRANIGISSPGVKLHGAGFIVSNEEAARLGLGRIEGIDIHLRRYMNGQDIAAKSRDVMVVDLFGLEVNDVRRQFPAIYQRIVEHVKPERDHNARASYRQRWWIFGEPRRNFRPALEGLPRYIATTESARRRYFVFLDGAILPDNMIVAIALADAYYLGILSARIHGCWALAAGGRLGIRHDPRYNKTRCFEPFPFPEAREAIKHRIRSLAEDIDSLRKRQQALHPRLTLTKLYKALDAKRAGIEFDEGDRRAWGDGLGATLESLHDDLDAAVFEAYGWPSDLTDEQILENLVTLNAERAAEEERGIIKWLRPEFQNPASTKAATQTTMEGVDDTPADDEGETVEAKGAKAWPKKLPEQIVAVREYVAGRRGFIATKEVAAGFKGAKRKDVEDLLNGLAALGVIVAGAGGQWRRAGKTAR